MKHVITIGLQAQNRTRDLPSANNSNVMLHAVMLVISRLNSVRKLYDINFPLKPKLV
jgi:hypothetical protein